MIINNTTFYGSDFTLFPIVDNKILTAELYSCLERYYEFEDLDKFNTEDLSAKAQLIYKETYDEVYYKLNIIGILYNEKNISEYMSQILWKHPTNFIVLFNEINNKLISNIIKIGKIDDFSNFVNDHENCQGEQDILNFLSDIISPPDKTYIISENAEDIIKTIKIDKEYFRKIFIDTYLKNPDNFGLFRYCTKDKLVIIRLDEDGVCLVKLSRGGKEFIRAASKSNCYSDFEYIDDLEYFIQLIIFLKYSKPEIIRIESGKKLGTKRDGYLNLNTIGIEVIKVNADWNRIINISRNVGFSVKGFIRLQRCGRNHSESKLKWINPFTKNGYQRTIIKKEAA
jgi:hypothetical protein